MKKIFLMILSAVFAFSSTSFAMGGGEGKIKCKGVAKKGQNDCAANGHACAGYAKKDYDPNEWVYKSEEVCKELQKKVAQLQSK